MPTPTSLRGALRASIAQEALGCLLSGDRYDVLPTRMLRAKGARILGLAGGERGRREWTSGEMCPTGEKKQKRKDAHASFLIIDRVGEQLRGSLKGLQPLHGNSQRRHARREGLEPAAPSGRNRQAERRKSQGATLASRLCEFPGRRNFTSGIIWSVPEGRARNDVFRYLTAKRTCSALYCISFLVASQPARMAS